METLKTLIKPSRYRKAIGAALISGLAVLHTLGADLSALVAEDLQDAGKWAGAAGVLVYIVENKLGEAKDAAARVVDELKARL